MKKTLLLVAAALLALPTMAYALDITADDGIANSGSLVEGWGALSTATGNGSEDNEVEASCYTGQNWDLEAILLETGDKTITLIGGYNWVSGYGSPATSAGDLFLAFAEEYETPVGGEDPTSPATSTVPPNTYGYDYVLDVNWLLGTYSILNLNTGTPVLSTTSYSQNSGSNPVAYVSGGSTVVGAGTFSMDTYNDGNGTNNPYEVALTGGEHHAVTFDMSSVWANLINYGVVAGDNVSLFAHITQTCGNDTMFGFVEITTPQEFNVPEPTSLLLLLLGLGGTLARKLRS